MTEEPIKPIDLLLSPQMIAYMEWLDYCQKQLDDYINKNIGFNEERNGKPSQSLPSLKQLK